MNINHRCSLASRSSAAARLIHGHAFQPLAKTRSRALTAIRFKPDDIHKPTSQIISSSDEEEARQLEETMARLQADQGVDEESIRACMAALQLLSLFLLYHIGVELAARRYNDELAAIMNDMDRAEVGFDNSSRYPEEELRRERDRSELRSEDEALMQLDERESRNKDESMWASRRIQEQEEEGKWERRFEKNNEGAPLTSMPQRAMRALQDAFLSVSVRNRLLHHDLKRINGQRSHFEKGANFPAAGNRISSSTIHNEMMDLEMLVDCSCDNVFDLSRRLNAAAGRPRQVDFEVREEGEGEGVGRSRKAVDQGTHTEEHWC